MLARRKREPIDPSPEYRDGLPLYRCSVCGDLCEELYIDDDGVCSECQPGADEDHRQWTDAERAAGGDGEDFDA